MQKSDIPFLTATELSRLIKAKEVSPVETVEAYLERINEVDPKLNAYITVCGDEAMAQAKESEQALAQGNYRGPMHGIPVAVKDQWWTKGIRTTAGSNILRDFIPDEDATVMTKLNDAGAILLGKTNLTEFAMAYTYHYPFGTPTNPWDLSRMPGGSSAGSGSATAASLCATSLGEDTAGSIRGPASYCGIVGLRPTTGRVSRFGLLGSCWSMDTIGPMSRTVEDCAMTLKAIAGHDPKDQYTWKTPVPDYAAALDGNIKGLRVGILKEPMGAVHLDTEVREATLTAIDVIKELGASVHEVSIPMLYHAGPMGNPIYYVEGAANHHERLRKHMKEYDHNMRITLLAASLLPAQTYYKAQRLREVFRADVLKVMETVDVLVWPTGPTPAPPIIDKPGLGTKEEIKTDILDRRIFTGLVNLAGVPGLSVPCGFSSSNLPIGLLISGRPMEEDTVFHLGHAYQQATDWHNRRPPI